jgi:vancomycin resistance protein YoaR
MLIGLGCLAVFVIVLCATDAIANYGKVHQGVSVAGVDVGGMTEAEAAEHLDRSLSARAVSTPIVLCEQRSIVSQLTMHGRGPSIELDSNMQDGSGHGSNPLEASAWRVSTLTISASVDGASLAKQAYAVGRSRDFFIERLRAWSGGVDLPGRLTYDEQQLEGLIGLLNSARGVPVIDADISFEEGRFVATPEAGGIGIDRPRFIEMLDQTFLGEGRTLFIPLIDIAPVITEAEAQGLAERCNQAVSLPVTLDAGQGSQWEISSWWLGYWLETSIVTEGEASRLAVKVDSGRMEAGLSEIMGGFDPGYPATNARFQVEGRSVYVIPSEEGYGIDVPKLALDLEGIIFGQPGASRRLTMAMTNLAPSFSTADAEAMHITQPISTYETVYGWSTEARSHNIELAASFIDYSLIAPHQIWSFNETAGDPSADRGFRMGKVISGNEYIDEVGGGVCQVATTVFNAVFEAGYPIISRAPHGLFQWQYAEGRDAAVFYDWLDMKWENDTDNWILLTMSCDSGKIMAVLWGTPPGYTVQIESGNRLPGDAYKTQRQANPEMDQGSEKVITVGTDGWIINVTRRVYDSQGNLIREMTFRSVYSPVTEVIEYGTKAPPAPPPEPVGEPPPAMDGEQ